jgi:taurine dioxygenase
VSGVDLSQQLGDDVIAELRQALLDHLVLFFRDQDITTDQQLAVARYFGEIAAPGFTSVDEEPRVLALESSTSKGYTNIWHGDDTWMDIPPFGAVLRAVDLPSTGGDTCFASMYAAFDALSAPLQTFLEGLTAVHSNSQIMAIVKDLPGYTMPEAHDAVHPVVSVHPDTQRKLLYVNSSKTTRIVELSESESSALLAFLYEHVKTPEFQCRFHWEKNSIAIWDNRALQHYAVADYEGQRMMNRVLIAGRDRPTGPKRT